MVPGLAILVAVGLAGQPDSGLASVIALAQDAFRRRDFHLLLDPRLPVRVELPSLPAAAPLRGGAAAAALQSILRRTEDVEIWPLGSGEIERGSAYVELRRRFRAAGTNRDKLQRILLSVRLVDGRWRVVEILLSALPDPR